MKPIFPASLALFGLVGGCASGLPEVRPLTYISPGEAYVFASGDKCPHEPADEEFAGLVAATLTGVASQLLKNFGTTLAEGAKGGVLTSSISTLNLELEPGRIPKCIVILRGAFQPTGRMIKPVDLAQYTGWTNNDTEQQKRLEGMNIPPVYRVDHYIELRIFDSGNGKALTFAPLFMKIDQSIDGGKKGERDLSIALKFVRVGSDSSAGSAILIADRRIGTASKWTPIAKGRYAIEAPWFGTFHAAPNPAGSAAPSKENQKSPAAPAPAGPIGAGGTGVGGAGSLPTAAAGSALPSMRSKDPSSVPVTLTATVIETRPTNEGLAFVASVFSGIQPKIETRLNQIIDSDARQTAENTEATADLNAQAEFAVAQGSAQSAVIAYCSTSSSDAAAAGQQDRLAKSQAARAAQLKANVAAIKANDGLLYNSLVVVSADLPNVVNPGPCR
ncbi:MAG: hypothetical protein O9286_07940 [Aquidulcibacter sp.]|uniref:hypothetical protein n=1 Tax=Aquidulcibacter sp. TaxID=2052990 RepID=UPI0022C7697B|nr:hypothetical protein [Aquidulcibacter sp.]